jgi:hypothetical protein
MGQPPARSSSSLKIAAWRRVENASRGREIALSWQERLPHSELAVARVHGGCEDKGRWFALLPKPSLPKQAIRARAASP